MRRKKVIFSFLLIMILALSLGSTGCFAEDSDNKEEEDSTPTTTVIIPDPEVVSVVASTSGTEDAYYVTVDMKVKNNGAEGVILITCTVTQDDAIQENETTIFLKQNSTYECKMTFPLEWKGGEFITDVRATLP